MDLPPPGSVIATYAFGPYTHFGIVSDIGTVISASKRKMRVVEESLEDFCSGHGWRLTRLASALPGHVIVDRARAHLGQPWKLLTSNCEHFVRDVAGLPRESIQVQVTLFAAFAYLLLRGR